MLTWRRRHDLHHQKGRAGRTFWSVYEPVASVRRSPGIAAGAAANGSQLTPASKGFTVPLGT
jgi:hypothetical protein